MRYWQVNRLHWRVEEILRPIYGSANHHDDFPFEAFSKLSDKELLVIRGIGPKRLAQIKEWVAKGLARPAEEARMNKETAEWKPASPFDRDRDPRRPER